MYISASIRGFYYCIILYKLYHYCINFLWLIFHHVCLIICVFPIYSIIWRLRTNAVQIINDYKNTINNTLIPTSQLFFDNENLATGNGNSFYESIIAQQKFSKDSESLKTKQSMAL